MFGPTITKDYLKGLARSASSDFLANGTPLTEAVVKQASACGAHLTSEHVRRICEMTYHDTYERMHKQACGADQYIVFDPPDAQIAAEILQSEKVASAQRATTFPSGGLMTEKTASAPEVRRFKFKPANAFDELMKTASTDHHDPYEQAQGMHDLRKLHSATKEAAAKIRSDLAASDTALMSARRELSKVAYATYKDGAALEDILHACFNGTDWAQTSQQSALKVASDLSEFLNTKVQKTVGLGINKHASFGDVNPSHPLPSAFTKVAALENQRVHLEIALGDIEQNLAYADEALKSALFGEKVAKAPKVSGSAIRSAGKAMRDHPYLTGAVGLTAVGGAGYAAKKRRDSKSKERSK